MRRKDRDAGQAMVEYALLAVFFFTLVIFLMDGSRILWGYVTVSHASAVGARYAITHGARTEPPAMRIGPGGYAALQTAVQGSAPGLDPAQIKTTAIWQNNSNAPGSRVTVEVAYNMQSVTSLFWAGQTLTLRGQSSMIIQN